MRRFLLPSSRGRQSLTKSHLDCESRCQTPMQNFLSVRACEAFARELEGALWTLIFSIWADGLQVRQLERTVV